MIIGAHAVVYSSNAGADRAFLRDVLGLSGVDVGRGWLVFGLPPAELAVHPAEASGKYELYLMCDDVESFVAEMTERGVVCSPVENPGWGLLTRLTLPGGGKLGVYQPRHARPPQMGAGAARAAKRPAKRAKPRPAVRRGRKAPKKMPKRRT